MGKSHACIPALFAALFTLGTVAPSLPAQTPAVEFNRDIRPILSDRCFACHGPDEKGRKTKMRIDVEASAKGPLAAQGKIGIVPGKPEESEIYQRIISDHKVRRMPPQYMGHDALPQREIDLIRAWIEQGAPWQGHWSFEPVRRPALPEVKDAAWVKNPIDRFVLRRLEREGLKQSPPATPATLLRRLSLDLTGLPPSPEEVVAFEKNPSDAAYEKAVDRMLASPQYAERMAIRWLEAARYADTNGYQSDGVRDMYRWRDWVIKALHENKPFDQFTIEQIAGDLIPNAKREQKIATAFHRNHRTSAEGGIVEEEFRVEYVADRVETTSTVWLGLTMGCARCHDHKYDPMTQKDFYSLFAFFNNTPDRGLVYNFGNEEPYIQAPTAEHERELAQKQAAVQKARAAFRAMEPGLAKAQAKWEKDLARSGSTEHWWPEERQVLHEPLDSATGTAACEAKSSCEVPVVEGIRGSARKFDGKSWVELGQDVAKFDFRDRYTLSVWIKPAAPNGTILSRMEDYWEGEGYGLFLKDGKLRFMVTRRFTDISVRMETKQPVKLNEWQHVAVTYDGYRKAKGFRFYIDGVEQEKLVEFDELTFPYGPKQPFRIGAGGGLRFTGLIDEVRVYDEPLDSHKVAALAMLQPLNELAARPAKQRRPEQTAKLRLAFLHTESAAKALEAWHRIAEAEEALRLYNDKIPTVMVLEELPEPRQSYVLNRGAYDAHGDPVSARVPEFLPPMPSDAPRNRLGLARWLVSRDNPLTSRVIANRFWQTLFGIGIVKTSEDFGSQGEWPTHPELLDWLASEFMESGWDMKALVKTMLLSATYRQQSKVTPALLEKDPENRLLARGPRYRLPADVVRDQALAASGLLTDKVGGPSVKPYQPPGLWQELAGGSGYQQDSGEDLYRRSLYTFWKRTVAPPNMINFDSPTREVCIVRLTRTNTPLQALNLMNDVAYLEAARKLGERMIREGGATAEDRLAYGWRLLLTRSPRPDELQVAEKLLHQYEAHYQGSPEAAAKYVAQGESKPQGDPAELAAYMGVASLLLNLDEAVTKE